MKPTVWEKKFLDLVRSTCKNYLTNEITFQEFQNLLETYFKNWENELEALTFDIVSEFLANIEVDYYLFEYTPSKRDSVIHNHIKKLLDYIDRIDPNQQPKTLD